MIWEMLWLESLAMCAVSMMAQHRRLTVSVSTLVTLTLVNTDNSSTADQRNLVSGPVTQSRAPNMRNLVQKLSSNPVTSLGSEVFIWQQLIIVSRDTVRYIARLEKDSANFV